MKKVGSAALVVLLALVAALLRIDSGGEAIGFGDAAYYLAAVSLHPFIAAISCGMGAWLGEIAAGAREYAWLAAGIAAACGCIASVLMRKLPNGHGWLAAFLCCTYISIMGYYLYESLYVGMLGRLLVAGASYMRGVIGVGLAHAVVCVQPVATAFYNELKQRLSRLRMAKEEIKVETHMPW